MRAIAPAKVNLALHILGRRASDGYHLLDSLVVFSDLADDVSFHPQAAQAGWNISAAGPYAPGMPLDETNLTARVAHLMAQRFGRHALGSLDLFKMIPHGAGLGGGSMDAAATAQMLASVWKLSDAEREELPELLMAVGADLPLCLSAWESGWQRMEGVGESVTPLAPSCPQLHAVLTHAGETLGTPQVYATCERADYREALPENLPTFANAGDLAEWLSEDTGNSLEAAACRISTTVPAQLQALRETESCLLSRMSGSGSACFGLYPSAESAKEAAIRLRAHHPQWMVEASRFGQPAPAILV